MRRRIERLPKIVEERSEAIDRTANESDTQRLAELRRSAQAVRCPGARPKPSFGESASGRDRVSSEVAAS